MPIESTWRRPASALLALLLVVALADDNAARARGRASEAEIRQLIRQLKEGPEGARNRAVQRLYLLRDPRGDRAVLELAADREASARAVGHWALAIVRPAGAAGRLRRGLSDDVAAVRREAVRGVGLLRPAWGARALDRRLTDEDLSVRQAAVRALARLGRGALRGLLRAARSRDNDVRLLAIAALARASDRRARSELTGLLRHGSPLVRLQVARELARSGDARAAKTLCQLTRGAGRQDIRLQAVAVMGDHPSAAGARCLRLARRRAEPSLRRAIDRALAENSKSSTARKKQ